MKIDLYISDLLYRYDCVIVPDFGGFVANYAAAKIHPVQHKFYPPSKQITFNKSLQNNDGLLANHIAQRKSISYAAAQELIKAFVDRSIEGLKKGDKIVIEQVGTIYLDVEEKWQFSQDESTNYLLDAYGMDTFRKLPVKRADFKERLEEQVKELVPPVKEEKKRRPIVWAAAASFLLLFGLSSVFYFQFDGSNQINMADFNPFDKEAPIYEDRTTELAEVERAALESVDLDAMISEATAENRGELPFTLKGIEEEEVSYVLRLERKLETAIAIDNTEVAIADQDTPLKYHVVGGCFSVKANAIGLVNQLRAKGFQASLVGKFKDLYTVSYQSYRSRGEAVKLLEAVKNGDNPSAWLLHIP